MKLVLRIFDKVLRIIENARVKYSGLNSGGGGYIGLYNRFYSPQNIRLDKYVHIGNNNRFYADAEISIGEGTIISDDCVFRTASHYYDGDDLRMLPYDERVICRPIVIGKNCWIGMGTIILSGIVIGEGAVVGAGSVVTKSVPKGAVIAGNPAKIIKYRNLDTYQMLADSNQQIMRTFDSYERLKIQEGVRKND